MNTLIFINFCIMNISFQYIAPDLTEIEMEAAHIAYGMKYDLKITCTYRPSLISSMNASPAFFCMEFCHS